LICFLIPRFLLSLLFLFMLTTPPLFSTLSLHDALPISSFNPSRMLPSVNLALPARDLKAEDKPFCNESNMADREEAPAMFDSLRSEEHTSELQSLRHLVCRLLLEKKKKTNNQNNKKNIT